MILPGVLDLPAPAIKLIDAMLAWAHIPVVARILLWGALAGWLSMAIYRRTSPQERLTVLRTELAGVRHRLVQHDGDFAGMQTLIFKQLGLSLRQLGLTLAPALLGAVPLFLLLPTMSNEFGLVEPSIGAPIEVCVTPSEAAARVRWSAPLAVSRTGCWSVNWPSEGTSLSLADAKNANVMSLPAPSNEVRHFEFFNWLVGNPAGYLPDDSDLEAVRIDLASREFLPWGPSWLRGWEALFFGAVFVTSLILKKRWRVL